MSEGFSNFLILILRGLVWIYDIISFPFYYFIQQPWKVRELINRTKSRNLIPGDPSSPVVRIRNGEPELLPSHFTVADVFDQTVKEMPNKNAFGRRKIFGEENVTMPNGKVLKKFDLGDYEWLSFSEANNKIINIAKGMVQIGMRPKTMTTIYAETRVEWMLTAQACFKINSPVVTIYSTLGEEGVVHGLNETECPYVFTSAPLLPRIAKNIDNLPNVSYIIYMEGLHSPDLKAFDGKDVKVMSFTELEVLGKQSGTDLSPDMRPTKDDMAVLMYTSGSTGTPKGVIINHEQILATIQEFASFDFTTEGAVFVAYLPLSHIYELGVEMAFISKAMPIGYSSPSTLTAKSLAVKHGCKGDVELIRPTISSSVPLILDRIRKNVTDDLEKRGGLIKAFFEFAVKYKSYWYKKGYGTPILNSIIFNKTKQIVGGRCDVIICGGAPVSPDTQELIQAILCVDFIQGYGMTETTGCASTTIYRDRTSGIVGPPLTLNQIKLVDWQEGNYSTNDKPNPRGEVVVGGQCVAQGYYKKPDLTEESFKLEDGVRWFYTGDIAEYLPDGNFKIIDRKKDLIKLQFGEYISLSKVETELKTCALVDNICVFGNSYQSFLVALVSPSKTQLLNLAKQLNKENLSIPDLCKDIEVNNLATKTITQHAQKCNLSRVEIPTKYKLCAEEWLPDSGLVTAAYKIRRKMIEQYYKKDIDDLYGMTTSPTS